MFVVDVGPAASVSGSSPPILLLHGLLATHFSFEAIIPLLARSRRVVAVDLLGCGDSDRPLPRDVENYSIAWLAERILELCTILELPAFDVVGHDLGGAIAVNMAASDPDRVRRLALLAPIVFGLTFAFDGLLEIETALGVEVFMRVFRRADLRRMIALGTSEPERVDETEVDVYWDRLARRGGREAAHAMMGQVRSMPDLRDKLRSVAPPTAIIWGDRDRIVSVAEAERLVALLPRTPRLTVLEGCGHNPAREQPHEVARLVLAHCE